MRLSTSAVAAALAIGLVVSGAPSPAGAAAPAPSQTELVSVSQSGAPGSAGSMQPDISDGGRYVVFTSAAQLTSIPHAPGTRQVYLRDTASGTTTMVSTSGGVSSDGDALSPSVSEDGRLVAFISNAANLGVRGGIPQAMLWSRESGTSRVLSLSSDAVPNQANGTISSLELSDDGSTATFATAATNLAGVDARSSIQVYAVGVTTGAVTLVSRDMSSTETTGGTGDSGAPSISDDGGAVAFRSVANLEGVPTGGQDQIYVRSADGSVRMVSVDPQGRHAANAASAAPTISGDGHTVAFMSAATDITDEPTNGASQIYLRVLNWGVTRLVSYAMDGLRGGARASAEPVLSDFGDVIVFESLATDLTPVGAPGDMQIYSRNVRSGHISLVSAGRAGAPGGGISNSASVSGDGHLVTFESTSNDLVSTTTPGGVAQIYLRNNRPVPGVERIGGADRFDVSAQVSAAAFAPHVPIAYVASGAVFPDALSGSAAAGHQSGPVLLVSRDSVPASVASELRRLRPAKIVILGGPNSIGDGVQAALAGYSSRVERITGADRYEVSAAISAATFPNIPGWPPTAFVASGAVFPDALSGSAAAGAFGGPVLLTQKDAVPDSVIAELHRLAPQGIVVLGGVNTVSESVVTALGAIAPTSRVGGADRYEVSANASGYVGQGDTGGTVFVSSGEKFPDALAGSPAAIRAGAPVLLVTSTGIPPTVAAELRRRAPTRIVVLGGPNTVSDAVLTTLGGYVVR
jgi:putative cell wall-binding protein/Tol biopolymer transport system component